ncbi:hypothetical protein TREVI0001_2478 [Treponema vincentii ATCC 35580]|jgi:hypothetical protein|uniref:Uncharacterized protein n=1 Tax=Treponema vincentii ATCC 35580 TaxID=596324 RepID=C8PST8_9SPIR|nr:hypothetical protein TREVI0001_2478 [Treponema vincentii ATCC 35580]
MYTGFLLPDFVRFFKVFIEKNVRFFKICFHVFMHFFKILSAARHFLPAMFMFYSRIDRIPLM